ncbi:MAG: PD-(D/E)XK nuclease family protein [Nitrospiria bacterium]
MNVVTGPFHPALEDALVKTVALQRAADPLAPVLVLVPSDGIRRRLAWRLAHTERLVLLNVHLVTFHQLSRRLLAEAGVPDAEIRDEGAFEELTRHLLSLLPSVSPLARVRDTPGGCAALWQTLRDLKDARVAPDLFLEAVRTDLFDGSDVRRLEALASLYHAVLDAAAAAGWTDYTDLDVAAAECVPRSRFLASASAILHYGFYDLTQVQYDLFHAVARHYETGVFFPLVIGHPLWEFAERFYRRFVTGVGAGRRERVEGPLDPTLARLFVEDPEQPAAGGKSAKLFECSGARDEVATAAKIILRLVEDEGFDWTEMAVVSRSLDPYGELVAAEFSAHGIPFSLGVRRSLAGFPLTHAVVAVLRAGVAALSEDDAAEVASSPYRVPGAEIDLSSATAAWRDGLPSITSGAEHAAVWRTQLDTLLGLTARAEGEDGDEALVAAALLAALDHPLSLDGVRPSLSREEFIAAVLRRIAAGRVPPPEGRGAGVPVLDAMAARGLPFRAVFLLGLNEGVFPRLIREDAFLRDAERRIIETSLGHKIPEKLCGYDEERLLFGLLIAAARERLFLFVQRSDEAGRPLVPSWYVDEWRRAAWGDQAAHEPVITIPRRVRDKRGVEPFVRYDSLTPREAAVRSALEGGEPGTVLEGPAGALERRGRVVRAVLDRAGPLTPYDGMVGAGPDRIAGLRAAGFSASALQRYACCPMQFMLSRLVGSRTRSPEADGIGAAEWGRLCHDALARVYGGWALDPPSSPSDARERTIAACREVFDRYARTDPPVYPLLWEFYSARWSAALAEAVAVDAADLAGSGFVPVATEVIVRGELAQPNGTPIQGRLDRIDRHPDGRLRVIDFKIGASAVADPVKSAMRGERLQPPIYAALGEAYARGQVPGPGAGEIEVELLVIGSDGEAPLTRLAYRPDTSAAGQIAETIAFLIDGIEEGWHAITPDRGCAWCDVAAACRRRHAPSRGRAEADGRSLRHAALRRTRPAPA